MAPLRLSYIWYRRLYIALFVISLAYVLLYALPTYNLQYIPKPVQVDLVVAICGTIVALASFVLVFLAKKITSFVPAFITFTVFALATTYLVQNTGGVESSFLPLWALTMLIIPVFGAYCWLPALVITSSYIAGEYLSSDLTTQTIVLVVMSSILPLIIGIISWREIPGSEEQSTKDVKHLATQLSEVATKSEIVINAIGDGVIAVDSKGVIQLINPAAQEILGWGKQDALMLNYKSIFKLADEEGNDIGPSQDPIQQVLNTNQQFRGNKLGAITNSGKKISVALVASPIGDLGSGAIAVFRDTTKERAEEREQAEFISTASHEMRTPVASIEGYLGLALNPNTATIDSKARDFILKAHESAQHLGRLFQDLLDVSKSEDGRLVSAPRVVDLVPLTQTIVQGLSQKATNKGLGLIFVPAKGTNVGQGIKKLMPVYYVNIDTDHIREVLDNLIENAIKYTPNGEVRVDITGSEDKVSISITDTGLGIPTEDISHLFQKFYRVNNMDRQAIGGTGLGLYLCRRLVEGMQGRIWVESEYGAGSTFYIELPRVDTQEASRLNEEQERQATQAAVMQPVVASVTLPNAPAIPPAPSKSIPVTFAETVAVTPQPVPQPAAVTPQTIPQTAAETSESIAQPNPTLTVKPASPVPRGEALTRKQIDERVRQLEALAQQQRGSITPPPRQ